MMAISILIPVLGRPHRVRPLVESIAASSAHTPLLPIFICSPGDTAEIAEATTVLDEFWNTNRLGAGQVLVVDWEPDHGDYPRKINYGFTKAQHEFVLTASDDLVFHPGWAERAIACYLETHACVVGTNDLGNDRVTRGQHSTHTLVHRDYGGCGTIDEPDSGKLLHEGYDHSFCDSEFVETAKYRQTWAHATDSVVEHHHPLWHKAADDATYRKGQLRFNQDRNLFDSRRHLWNGTG